MLTFAIYAVCILGGSYVNRKATWFHPLGWAGIAMLAAAMLNILLNS